MDVTIIRQLFHLYLKLYRNWWIIIVLFALLETTVIPVYKRGFFCDDRSIIFKFNGDTVTTPVLLTVLISPVLLFWLLEYLLVKESSTKRPRWKKSLRISLSISREYVIGQIINLGIIEFAKTMYGGLRPHFLDTCIPDALETCTPGEFVSKYECTNKDVSRYNLLDSQKSFPSGHASTSVFQALFLIYYLHTRVKVHRMHMLVPFLHLICLAWGIFCPISRITDYRHHWWDVLFGMIIGIATAMVSCFLLRKNVFLKLRAKDNDEEGKARLLIANTPPLINGSDNNNDMYSNSPTRRSEV